MREAISAHERLTLTLGYLASGDDQQSLSFSCRIGRTTVSHIIKETLHVIWLALKDKYVGPPKSANNWKNISKVFESTWHLPHCIGAIDGKHIAIQCPQNSGSLYYNYKEWFSIVLLALCDACYNFTLADIDNAVVQMTAVCLITLKWEKHLKMGLCYYPSQNIFWVAAYLLSPISW